jgi:hypothetical protein
MARCRALSWTLLASLTAAVGCTPEAGRYIHFPELYGPGTAQEQRAIGVVHDPYPLDDVGPPVTGGRPLAYEKPVPEVTRANMFDNARRRPTAAIPVQSWPLPPPGATVQYPAGAPAVLGSPYAVPAAPAGPTAVPASPFAISGPPAPPATGIPYTVTPSPAPQAVPFQQQQRSPY